ncbi:RidA family protein [Pseudorhodobacter sp.]|uniref:RidA family protein n=1 Tax=Pseudorhodobacter sp. TaxID=1934400 RepID=UPI002648423E|nr:RidA family protein [Pseudorhodobacter sp.]MDN5786440.1 RidA family protein [Pseudorhodobacter sp.]
MKGSAPRVPVPQGNYLPARRHGNLIFTSGMTPRRDGVLVFKGAVRKDALLDDSRAAVVLACNNALTAARGVLAAGEALTGILSLTVYVAAEPGFEAHSKLADFASAFLCEAMGEQGIGVRAAVGVATLPGDAPIEIQLVAFV